MTAKPWSLAHCKNCGGTTNRYSDTWRYYKFCEREFCQESLYNMMNFTVEKKEN